MSIIDNGINQTVNDFEGGAKKNHENDKEKDITYEHEIVPKKWVASNHADFLEWMNKTFKYASGEQPETDACSLFDHQRFIKDYMQSKSPYRGVLLYHGLGVGKTRASIAVAESLRPNVKKVIVMLPASLRQNFINEIIDCGNREFAKEQYWKSVKIDVKDTDDVKEAEETYGVSKAHIKKFGRIWKVSTKKTREEGSNWESLKTDWPEIMTYITASVLRKYEFINYNGLRHSHVQAMEKTHFDDSVVIIDEAHNFTSRVVNGQVVDGKIVGRKVLTPIYQMLMDAKNLKIVMLSGTPLINRPIELAYTLNLLRGYIEVQDLYYRSTREFSLDAVQTELDNHPVIDMAQIDAAHKRIRIALVPDGYAIDGKGKYMSRDKSNATRFGKDAETRLDSIKSQLETLGAQVGQIFPRKFTALPVDEERFDELFINYKTKKAEDAIKNQSLFARRITGLVSYFEAYNPEHYPHLEDTEVVEVAFSEEHFNKYMEMRDQEAEKETKSKNNKRMQKKNANANHAKDQLTENSTYRSFSRALCNFCFPESIDRKFPRDIRAMQKELDDGDNEFANAHINPNDHNDPNDDGANDAIDLKKSNAYEASIAKALADLKAHEQEYLIGKPLRQYGPKYYEIMHRIKKSPGSVLIYSQFRTVEGAAIMGLVLEAHGHAELRVVRGKDQALDVTWNKNYKYSPEKPFYVKFVGSAKEETQLLMNLFNSNWKDVSPDILNKLKEAGVDVSMKKSKGSKGSKGSRNLRGQVIKAMIITQSGSEGISLRNIRQVHILEPYWNEIRIKQVIGRAVRAKSHEDLLPEERNVRVFQYIAVFSDRQLKIPMVDTREERKTSDVFIQSIATRKGFINNSLLHILKNTAIDCRINLQTHQSTQPNQNSTQPIQCFKLPEGYQRLSFVYGDIEEDETDAQMALRTTTMGPSDNMNGNTNLYVTIYVDTENTEDRTKYQPFPYDKQNNFVYDKTDFDMGHLRIIGRVDTETEKVVWVQ